MRQCRFGFLAMALMLGTTLASAGVLGTTNVDLDGTKIRSEETNLGSFVADAIRNAAGADIGIVHANAFKPDAQIPKGVVDEQVFSQRFNLPTGKLATLKLSPVMLRQVLQYALKKYPEGNLAFLQVSGMEVTFDSAKPATTRIVSIRVGGKLADFSDRDTRYTVAMPQDLATGAVGYHLLFDDEVVKSMSVKDITLLEAIAKEFDRQKGVIAPKTEGRLKDVNPNKPGQ